MLTITTVNINSGNNGIIHPSAVGLYKVLLYIKPASGYTTDYYSSLKYINVYPPTFTHFELKGLI